MSLLPKDADILSPCDDRVFKLLLTAPKAKPTLKLVIEEIVQQTVEIIEIRNAEMPVNDTEGKQVRFDVNCKINNDMQSDIEMQAWPMGEVKGSGHSNLRARSIFSLCKLHASQKSKGIQYGSLSRTYQVMFCGFTVFRERKNFINTFSMRHDTDNELLHNAIQSIFVELTKLKEVLKKPIEQMTNMERFAIFLKYADNPRYRETVNDVIKSKEELIVASEVLQSISRDERERAIFQSRLKARMDTESNLASAKQNGINEGIVKGRTEGIAQGRKAGIIEGRKEGIISVARNALLKGMLIADIADLTGLTHKEIENIRG